MENSPLGRLSAELRNTIYELTFIEASPLDLSAGLRGQGSLQHPLTQTCRQMRAESLMLFYSSTDFELDSKFDVRPLGHYFEENQEAIEAAVWLFGLDPARLILMRSVGFRGQHKIMSPLRYREFVAEETQNGKLVGIGKRMIGNYHTACSTNGIGTLVKAYRKVLDHRIHLVARLVNVEIEDRGYAEGEDEGWFKERANGQWRMCGFVVLKEDDDVGTLGGVTANNERQAKCQKCGLCVKHTRLCCPPSEPDTQDPYWGLWETTEKSFQLRGYAYPQDEKKPLLMHVFEPIFEEMRKAKSTEAADQEGAARTPSVCRSSTEMF